MSGLAKTTSYSDIPTDSHSYCNQLSEDAIDQTTAFCTVATEQRGGVFEVLIYRSPEDVEPFEWFGSACCANRASAMALNDFNE